MSVGRAVPTSLCSAAHALFSSPVDLSMAVVLWQLTAVAQAGNLHLPLVTNAQPPTAPCLEFDERTFSRNAKT
jgi:hypothetical protein